MQHIHRVLQDKAMMRMEITLKTPNAFFALQVRRIQTAAALLRRASPSNSVALVNKKIKLLQRCPIEHAKLVMTERTLRLVPTPALRTQAAGSKY